MPQDRNDLPEGTDKTIRGASAEGPDRTVTADTTLVAEKPAAAARKTTPKATAGEGASDGTMMEKIRTGRDKLSGQAADKTRDYVGQGLERSSEALTNISKLVGETATGIDERLGAEYGDYARRAADAINRTAQSLARKDPDELIDDTRNFVRKSPGVALAGAAVVGFALARLIKSGLESTSATDDEDGDADTTRSTRR